MKNFEKSIAAYLAANVWNLKLTFWAGLVMSVIGCGGIVYAILTPPLSTMPLYSKLAVGFMGLLLIFCVVGLGVCYRKARKSYQEYVALNKKALEQE